MIASANNQTFSNEVLDSPIPVLVNFWAPWCGLCRMLDPTLTRLHEQWGSRLKLINVNADENLQLANIYRLKSLPTLMLFDQGTVRQRLEHFRNSDDLRRVFDDLNIAMDEIMLTLTL